MAGPGRYHLDGDIERAVTVAPGPGRQQGHQGADRNDREQQREHGILLDDAGLR
jgi:hypothetical protein